MGRGVAGLLLAVPFEGSQLCGVCLDVAVQPAQRRPVHAGRDGQEIVQDGRRPGVVADGEHAQGRHFVHYGVLRQLPQGLLIELQGTLVVTLFEGCQRLIEKLIGFSRLRRFRGGSRRLGRASAAGVL